MDSKQISSVHAEAMQWRDNMVQEREALQQEVNRLNDRIETLSLLIEAEQSKIRELNQALPQLQEMPMPMPMQEGTSAKTVGGFYK